MNQKNPFFKSRRPSVSFSTLKRRGSLAAGAVIAAVALLMAAISGGWPLEALRFFEGGQTAAPNALLAMSSQARGVPQVSLNIQAASTWSWLGIPLSGRVASFLDPAQAGRQLPSVDLPLRAQPGISAVAPDSVADAMAAAPALGTPRAIRKGRPKGRRFSRRYRVGKESLCVGAQCSLRRLSDLRLLTASNDPCLPLKGCVSEDAVADENSVYDGSLTPSQEGPSPLSQDAPEINLNAKPGFDGQIQGEPQAQAQAQDLTKDSRRCVAADAVYFGTSERPGPQITAQQDFSHAYRNLENSGCLAADDSSCAAERAQTEELCRQFDAVRMAHYEACPLSARMGPYESAQCVL